jgi:hypothetical protein
VEFKVVLFLPRDAASVPISRPVSTGFTAVSEAPLP